MTTLIHPSSRKTHLSGGDRFGIGGRTGGFNERKVIDDVEITTR